MEGHTSKCRLSSKGGARLEAIKSFKRWRRPSEQGQKRGEVVINKVGVGHVSGSPCQAAVRILRRAGKSNQVVRTRPVPGWIFGGKEGSGPRRMLVEPRRGDESRSAEKRPGVSPPGQQNAMTTSVQIANKEVPDGREGKRDNVKRGGVKRSHQDGRLVRLLMEKARRGKGAEQIRL